MFHHSSEVLLKTSQSPLDSAPQNPYDTAFSFWSPVWFGAVLEAIIRMVIERKSSDETPQEAAASLV